MGFVGGSERGSSLVAVLVALALVGILAFTLSTFLNNSFASLRKIEISGDMQDIRRLMRLMIDCTNTKAANSDWGSCNGSTLQEGRDATNKIVIQKGSSGTALGAYKVALKCTKGSNVNLLVEVTKGGAVVSPNVFKTVPFTCAL